MKASIEVKAGRLELKYWDYETCWLLSFYLYMELCVLLDGGYRMIYTVVSLSPWPSMLSMLDLQTLPESLAIGLTNVNPCTVFFFFSSFCPCLLDPFFCLPAFLL
jgi:hypothetical protein